MNERGGRRGKRGGEGERRREASGRVRGVCWIDTSGVVGELVGGDVVAWKKGFLVFNVYIDNPFKVCFYCTYILK